MLHIYLLSIPKVASDRVQGVFGGELGGGMEDGWPMVEQQRGCCARSRPLTVWFRGDLSRPRQMRRRLLTRICQRDLEIWQHDLVRHRLVVLCLSVCLSVYLSICLCLGSSSTEGERTGEKGKGGWRERLARESGATQSAPAREPKDGGIDNESLGRKRARKRESERARTAATAAVSDGR